MARHSAQLDVEHLRRPGPTEDIQSATALARSHSADPARTESAQDFCDVCLADEPRFNNVAIGKFSAHGTPRKLISISSQPGSPSKSLQSTPSKQAQRPPLTPIQPHKRSTSDPSATSGPQSQRRLPFANMISSQVLGERSNSGRDLASEPDPVQAKDSSQSRQPTALTSDADSMAREPSSHLERNNSLPSTEDGSSDPKAPLETWKARVRKELLLFMTVLGVLVGISLGFALRPAHLSARAIELVGFPGEIMLRLLKMLVLPLVAGSMISGVCALRTSDSSLASVARNTFTYYAVTTLTAVILGIALVNILSPGQGQPLAGGTSSSCSHKPGPVPPGTAEDPVSALEALLRVFRSIFPDNIAVAAVDMNILGIITIALLFGLALASIGPSAEPFINGVDVFNQCISKIVMWVLWISPVGVASLIAAAMIRACDLTQTVIALGMWVLTVLIGLALFAGILLPFLLWIITRHNPWIFVKKFSRALVLAFGTSSSSAALPVAMDCAADFGCGDSIIKFVLPLGTTINMNGTALYEAVTVIFIAQAHGVHLGFAETLVVAVTATLAAVGAAAIPSAGLVTMLMVLQAVNLEQYAGDLAIILAIDWFLDRCRTAVNLMSDCLAVVVVDHLAKHAHGREYSQIELAL